MGPTVPTALTLQGLLLPPSSLPGSEGEKEEWMKSVALLLKAQADMIAAHAQAMTAPPLPMFTGEGDQTGDDNFEHW